MDARTKKRFSKNTEFSTIKSFNIFFYAPMIDNLKIRNNTSLTSKLKQLRKVTCESTINRFKNTQRETITIKRGSA